MEKLTEEELLTQGVQHIELDGKLHFNVVEVRKHQPDYKINTDAVKEVGGTMYVTIENIVPMTEFDKNVMKDAG